jgi:hypothetical protein
MAALYFIEESEIVLALDGLRVIAAGASANLSKGN